MAMVKVVPLLSLLLSPEPVETMRKNKACRFIATLGGSGAHVVTSHQPLVDGARELLARGFPPDILLTMRHAGKFYDSFAPQPIGEWAKWTYGEGQAMTLQRRPWKARGDIPEGQK